MNTSQPEIPSSSGQSSLKLFEAAVNATSNGVVITDHRQPDEPIIYCNDAFMALTGYVREDIIGHNCRFLQADDRDQEARDILREAIKNGEHCRIELRNYKKNGTLFWNELIMSPVKDEQGTITHFIGVQADITGRKEAERALKSEQEQLEQRVRDRTQELEISEAYMASIVETVRESLVVLNQEMKILSVNENFCQFFKLAEDEVRGKVLFDLNQGEWNVPELQDLLLNVLPSNNPFEGFEFDNTFAHIGRKVLLLNARQVTLRGKYQDRILLAMEDKTDERDAEQRKGDFVSIASHEMKTPLTSIKGNIQMMQRRMEKNNNGDYSGFLEKADRSINRLEKLVADLLDVAGLQEGNVVYDYRRFDFDLFIRDVIESIQAAQPSHEIIITGQTGQQIEGDASRLEQVMINLLNNAVKYSPEASQVHIYLSVVSNYVKVSITDYGVGIKQEEQKKIFGRFYRAGQSPGNFQGVGIGLYISNKIIQEHRGSLWVESSEGVGSVFNFTVPVNRPTA
jgi:PAS domain S-box-containing protein